MKQTFAKIFELENYQVLITKEETDEGYLLNQTTEVEEVRVNLALNFHDEHKRDGQFDRYDEKSAKAFIRILEEMK